MDRRPNRTNRVSRRQFVKTTGAVGAGFWVAGGVAPKKSLAAIEEIRFACIGVGGKGVDDSNGVGALGKVVAICDIDGEQLDKAQAKFPDAKAYFDYRKLLDEMHDSIDAVTVTTPDHTHAVIAMSAMALGKHVYCQKPLTHSIEEARLLAQRATEKKVVTQMGNQGTALDSLRRSAALIKAGVIGNAKEVHIWTNRPVWPQGFGIKPKIEPAPEYIHWDLWLGPAKSHPFSPEIHPFKWRGYWAFGTGALGDMACHTLNMSYMALDLNNAVSVQADAEDHDKYAFPGKSTIEFQFAANDWRPAVKMFWYDGGRRPLALLKDCPKQPGEEPGDPGRHFTSGALIIGEKGMFYSPGDYGEFEKQTGIIIDGQFTMLRDIETPVTITESPGHYEEFAQAIRGETKTVSNFPGYASGLTETVLLGNLAVWARGHRIDWDAPTMGTKLTKIDEKCPDCVADEVALMVRHEYHNGFDLASL
jgi:predicted dehydrogenase